jgi:hypothetical protein
MLIPNEADGKPAENAIKKAIKTTRSFRLE